MKTLSDIELIVKQHAAKIDAPNLYLPTFGYSADAAQPHIEVDSLGYHFVVVERGQELERKTTHGLDDLLYFIFESVTFNVACKYELAHRVEGQDFRRILFARQIELLTILSPSWADRESRDHERILQEHPFRDN